MTEKEKILFSEFFTQYGSPSVEANRNVRLYIMRPDRLDTLDRVEYADQIAAEKIEELEKYIDFLKIYRRELVARYNEIATAAALPGIKLIREKRYRGNVYYKLILYTHYIDFDQDVIIKTDTYPGKERHTAINAYNSYVKSHPGIIASMDIDKSKWEK